MKPHHDDPGDPKRGVMRNPPRNFDGYRGVYPEFRWPGGGGLAVSFVLNVEEGAELSLTAGDEVMTTAGLFGTITAVSDSKVDLEIAPGVVVTMLKLAVKEKTSVDEDEYDEDDTVQDGTEVVEGSAARELDRPGTGTEVRSDPDRLT